MKFATDLYVTESVLWTFNTVICFMRATMADKSSLLTLQNLNQKEANTSFRYRSPEKTVLFFVEIMYFQFFIGKPRHADIPLYIRL